MVNTRRSSFSVPPLPPLAPTPKKRKIVDKKEKNVNRRPSKLPPRPSSSRITRNSSSGSNFATSLRRTSSASTPSYKRGKVRPSSSSSSKIARYNNESDTSRTRNKLDLGVAISSTSKNNTETPTNKSGKCKPPMLKPSPSLPLSKTKQENKPSIRKEFSSSLSQSTTKEDAGTSTTCKSQHFLEGISLNDCKDILSIPDPPSPGKISSRRRRMSTGVLPLRDLTNDSDVEGITPKSKQAKAKSPSPSLSTDSRSNSRTTSVKSLIPSLASPESYAKKRRSRMSLCHVPATSAATAPFTVEPTAMKMTTEATSTTPFLSDTGQNEFTATANSQRNNNLVLEQVQTISSTPTTTSSPSRNKRRNSFSLEAPPLLQLPPSSNAITRRKRRQSMLLPSTLCTEEELNEHFEPFLEISPKQSRIQINKGLPIEKKKKLSLSKAPPLGSDSSEAAQGLVSTKKQLEQQKHDINVLPSKSLVDISKNMATIRQLVRDYTSRTLEQRWEANEVKTIEKMTGYQLTPALPDNFDWEMADVPSRKSKLDMFTAMGPNLQKMDDSKRRETKYVEEKTSCVISKSSGGSKFQYCTDDHSKISAAEYEKRYMVMLRGINAVRSKKWAYHFEKLSAERSNIEGDALHRNSENVELLSTDMRSKAENSSEINKMEDVDDYDEDNLNMKLPAKPRSMPRRTTATAAATCEVIERVAPTLTKTTDITTLSTDAIVKEQQDLEKQTLSIPYGETALSKQLNDLKDKVESPARGSGVTSTCNTVVLSLPSRDVASSEPPEIARAVETLWTSIDAALDLYAQEVQATQKAGVVIKTNTLTR